jgi:glycosyltransferase involved in cell wall biosynthesis
MGRIDPIKNLEALLLAIAKLKPLQPHLVLVGPVHSQRYFTKLTELAREIGICQRLHVVGPLYGSEKIDAYQSADLLALVSVRENWGNVVPEAITAGIPVVVSDTCGVAEIVHDQAGVVVSGGVDAIAAGIGKLLTDKALYETYRRRLPDIANALSWDQPVLEMERLFLSWA